MLARRLCLATTLALLALSACAFNAWADPDLIAEFPVPSEPSGISKLTVGADGNLWFTEEPKAIGRITPQGLITEFPFASPGSPKAIVAGPDGNLWFTEAYPGGIGRITPSGQITDFPLAGAAEPKGIAPGPDGNVWFTAGSSIGKITPSGQITEFALPPKAFGGSIITGPDGNLWFTEESEAASSPPEGRIGRITPSGQITDFPLAPKTYGRSIFAGPDGNLRFTFERGSRGKYGTFNTEASGIGVLSPTGQITEQFPGIGAPSDITAAPDGNLWFLNGDIGRLTPQGQVTKFEAPWGGSPNAITVGPDGNLWFAGNRLAEHHVSSVIGRMPPGVLEVELRGEWWSMRIRGRWTAIRVACVGGGPGSACSGTLRLTTEIGSTKPGAPEMKMITLARRRYSLNAETEHEFALRVSKKTLGVRIGHTNLRNVQVTATANGGQDTSRPLNVLEREPRQRRTTK